MEEKFLPFSLSGWLYAPVILIPAVKSKDVLGISEDQGMDCENFTDMKISDMPQNKVSRVSTTPCVPRSADRNFIASR